MAYGVKIYVAGMFLAKQLSPLVVFGAVNKQLIR